MHCKDVRATVLARARNRDASFLDAVLDGVFTVPGDGMRRLSPACSRRWRAAATQGWLVVEAEQDPAVAPPRQNAERGLRTLQTLAQRLFN